MNEIDIILVKINKEINDIAGMKSSFDRYISIKDLIKDQLTKYGRAVRDQENYKYLLGHLMYVSEWQPELIKEAYSELSQEDKDLFKKKIELIQKIGKS